MLDHAAGNYAALWPGSIANGGLRDFFGVLGSPWDCRPLFTIFLHAHAGASWRFHRIAAKKSRPRAARLPMAE